MEQSSYMKQPSLILSVKEEENATQRSGWSLCSDCWFGCFGSEIAESPRPSLHFSLLASVPWTMVAKVDFSFSSGSWHVQGLKLDLAVWHEVLTSSRGSQAYLQVRCLSTALFGLTASGKCLSHQLSQTASALQQVKIAHFQPQQSGVLSSYHKPSWKKFCRKSIKNHENTDLKLPFHLLVFTSDDAFLSNRSQRSSLTTLCFQSGTSLRRMETHRWGKYPFTSPAHSASGANV